MAALSDATQKALASAEVRRQLQALQLQPLPLGAEAFGTMIRSETPFWAEFLRRSGIRLEP